MDYLSRRAAKLQSVRMQLESIYRCPSLQPVDQKISYRAQKQGSQKHFDNAIPDNVQDNIVKDALNEDREDSEEIYSWQDCCITVFLIFFLLFSSSIMLGFSVNSIFQSAVFVQQKVFSKL